MEIEVSVNDMSRAHRASVQGNREALEAILEVGIVKQKLEPFQFRSYNLCRENNLSGILNSSSNLKLVKYGLYSTYTRGTTVKLRKLYIKEIILTIANL